MKSNKQRRQEIKAKRRARAEAMQEVDRYNSKAALPLGAVKADHSKLDHNNTYSAFPEFYIDRPFICRDCGSHETWTAKQQKWWYEIAKGHIDSIAVQCRPCRNAVKREKDQQKEHMTEMARKEPHPNEQFFNKRFE